MATSPNPSAILTATQETPDCGHLAIPEPFSLVLSICLVIGILGSYLPQHYKIIRKGTSAGLSPGWVTLGAIASILAFANIIVQPSSQYDMSCCHSIGRTACFAAMLGIVQVGVQWFCFMIILVLFVMYFPTTTVDNPDHLPDQDLPDRRSCTAAWLCSAIVFITVLVVSIVILVRYPGLSYSWANVLGIIASILSTFQYLPQIWTTWTLGHVYSLSIPSMCIQVPGAYVFAFSLYLRVGMSGWSTWLVYCVTGALQGVLLGMAITFDLRERYSTDTGESNEREPLLGSNGGPVDSARQPVPRRPS